MEKLDIAKYEPLLEKAIRHFWDTRGVQKKGKEKTDQGNRSAVTGGKQLDGFVELLVTISQDMEIPKDCIYTKGNTLPGYFRPTKDWDFVIISPEKKLIAVVEFKSQVGSFGNNFNNRSEEALGSAVDIWTAYREKGFPQVQPPWIGYLILVEKSDKSTRTVNVKEPHYAVRPEFNNTSYLDRYVILCQKLMLEKHYSAAALIWSDSNGQYGSVDTATSVHSFLLAFMGYIQGKLSQFKL